MTYIANITEYFYMTLVAEPQRLAIVDDENSMTMQELHSRRERICL